MFECKHEWRTCCRKCGAPQSQPLEDNKGYISILIAGFELPIVEYALDDANLLVDWSGYGFLNNDEVRSAMLNGFPVSEDDR